MVDGTQNEESRTTRDTCRSRAHAASTRACDPCRRRKVRCDGDQEKSMPCHCCQSHNIKCTYEDSDALLERYVESLGDRLNKLEALLYKICPSPDVAKALCDSTMNPELSSPSPLASQTVDEVFGSSTAIPKLGDALVTATTPPNDGVILDSSPVFQCMKGRKDWRFFGLSSRVALIQAAMEHKKAFDKSNNESGSPSGEHTFKFRRPEFWDPWDTITAPPVPVFSYTFPDPDLLNTLADVYFTHVNVLYPLLHRPTFANRIKQGHHRTDEGFGAIVLAVCAIGARYHTLEPDSCIDFEEPTLMAGWKYFKQVQARCLPLVHTASLTDLQFYVLAILFLSGTWAITNCWTLAGTALRLAQDIGAHRNIKRGPGIADELRKRAFWCLVLLDRSLAAALGRPCGIQEEDFDLEYPLEIDDEYLGMEGEDEGLWQQPADEPSLITSFVWYIKLSGIMGACLRTIYATSINKAVAGLFGENWEQQVVMRLDSKLNNWINSMPEHLRWDPDHQDPRFLTQSAFLYANYYDLQILVHRTFIRGAGQPSPTPFPSLTICTKAARSTIHVLDHYRVYTGQAIFKGDHLVFKAGIVLLFSIWGAKRSGRLTDVKQKMADMDKCLEVLRFMEKSWQSAGRATDVLLRLASFGELPVSPRLSVSSVPYVVVESANGAPGTTLTTSILGGDDASTSSPLAGPSTDVHHPTTSSISAPDEDSLRSFSEPFMTTPIADRQPLDRRQCSPTPAALFSNMPLDMNDFPYLVSEPFTSPHIGFPDVLVNAGSSQTSLATPPAAQVRPELVQSYPNSEGFVDSDMVAMWANAPQSFEFEDWNAYLTDVGQYAQQNMDAHTSQ